MKTSPSSHQTGTHTSAQITLLQMTEMKIKIFRHYLVRHIANCLKQWRVIYFIYCRKDFWMKNHPLLPPDRNTHQRTDYTVANDWNENLNFSSLFSETYSKLSKAVKWRFIYFKFQFRQEHTLHTYTVANDWNQNQNFSPLFGKTYSKLSKAVKSSIFQP